MAPVILKKDPQLPKSPLGILETLIPVWCTYKKEKRKHLGLLGLKRIYLGKRICPISKIEKEDEYHFLNICPAYQEKRCLLLDYLEKEYRIKISRMSPNKLLMFLINPPSRSAKIQKLIAKHVFKTGKGKMVKSKYSGT